MAITWPEAANAQVIEPPAHRIDFTVSPALPKCNDYDSFYGILVNWVRVRSILPTANRRLAIDIQRRPDGQKVVKLTLLDAEGAEIGRELHNYGATEECFKVLYWTAWDSTRLLQRTVVPPEESPPMSVDKLVEEVERSGDVPVKPRLSSETWPICVREPDPPQTASQASSQTPSQEAEKLRDVPKSPYRLVLGVGLAGGLTRMVMPGFRMGLERPFGPVVVGLDARLFPPLVSANDDAGKENARSGQVEAYIGGLSLCKKKGPLLGCALVLGGATGYSYDKAIFDEERFAKRRWQGVWGLGLRAGTEFRLNPQWALRVDAEVSFAANVAAPSQPTTRGGDDQVRLTWSGFVSVVPSF